MFPDDVHAHAAAGNIGDLLGGGETRFENEGEYFVLAEIRAVANQTFCLPSFENSRAVQAPAIVGDFDDDLAALMIGQQYGRMKKRT